MNGSARESALVARMQELGFSDGMVVTAMHILSQFAEAQEKMLLYLYDEQPSETEFIEHLAEICRSGQA